MAGKSRGGASDAALYLPATQARWLVHDSGHGAWKDVEGTLAFADVSGFTGLSERLAQLGRVGAEELTELINAVVGTLLDITASHGGDLLRYGGDALLVLFDGPGHERRAVAAAASMQRAMREFRDVRSRAGRVTLRMSVGLEAGPVNLFLAGSDHRELLVAGSTASASVNRQHAAAAGAIVLGERIASILPPGSISRSPDGHARLRLTRNTELAPTGESVPPQVPQDVPVAGIPVALRAHLGTVDGEHRQAAVAFVQCRNLDDLLEALGREAVADALHALVTTAQQACAGQDVTFLATDVDVAAAKLILVAGAPTTVGDDEDRLVAAVRSVLDTELPLPVRAGVHRGRVFAVEVGTNQRRMYTVLGDTVNVAARLMDAAPDGGLMVSTDVLDRLQVSYARHAVEPVSARGRATPVLAALIGPPGPGADRSGSAAGQRPWTGLPRPEGPLVGREQELATLTAARNAARAGQGSVVELLGEPGIGKSRLLAEVCAGATDLLTLVVQARQYATTQPYRALRDPLRLVLGLHPRADDDQVADVLTARVREVAPELEPLAPLLGIPFGIHLPDTPVTADLTPDFRREQLQRATIRFLSAMLPDSGMLVVEDAYWLDDSSAQLLARLIRGLQDRHWATFVARRSDGSKLDLSEIPGATRLELGPLPAGSARELAEVTGLGSTTEVAAVVERSGGNPLFLAELAAAAQRGTAVSELPDSIEAVIATHLDTLDAADRDLVRIAAVLGTEGPIDLLADLVRAENRPTERAIVLSGLRELEGVLVNENGRFRFVHALMREGAYGGLSFRRRRQLHGQAGDLIKAHSDGDRQAAALSLHYHAAGRHRACWHWSRLAAEQASRDAAPVEAVALLSRAVDSASGAGIAPLDRAEAYEQLGDVAELGGLYQRATDAYRRARRLRRGDHVAAGDLLRKQGHVAEREARYAVALQLYTRGFRALSQGEPSPAEARVRVELTLAYGAARLRQGQYDAAIRELTEAVRQAETMNHRRALAHAYYLLDWAHTDLGDPQPRYRSMALPIFEELGDFEGQGNVLINLGVDAYYEGRWDEALDYYRRSREAYERVGAAVLGAAATNNIGEVLSDQGHLDAARAEFEAALDVWRISGYAIGVGLATANLGRAATRYGRLDEAEKLLAAAVAELRRIGADSQVVDIETREAERLLMIPASDAALQVARQSKARAEQPVQQASLDRVIGLALAQQGDQTAARSVLDQSLAAAIAADARYEEALTRLAICRVSGLGGASAPFDPEADAILVHLNVICTPLFAATPSETSRS